LPQIVIRQLPVEVHRALKQRAIGHGRSTEAEVRDIIACAVLPENRPKAGDLLCAIWKNADAAVLTFDRDQTPHEPINFE
jgi:antitoxin FitA